MKAEQRAELHSAYTARVQETDAERRDRGWALASERGVVIAEMVSALREARDALAGAPNTEGLHVQIENAIKRGRAA